MVLTHIDLKYVSLIYRKIHQKVPNGKGLNWPVLRWEREKNSEYTMEKQRGHVMSSCYETVE